MCGVCCSGSSGSVRFTEEEASNMAKAKNLELNTFLQKFARRRGRGEKKYYELKETRNNDGTYDCIFLDRTTIPGKAVCSIYESKPTQCTTWPWWPEVLESPESWNSHSKGLDGCPGINEGKNIDVNTILEQLERTEYNRGELM